MKLSTYVLKRNGVPMGHSRSLRNNLKRSLGAKNFSAFWTYWNPIFGYYLGTRIFRPLKTFLPANIALLITFMVCGLVHDFVTILIRNELSLFFTVWFFYMGSAVVISQLYRYNLAHKSWVIRAFANIAVIAFCLLLTIYLNNIFNFY